MMNRRIKRINSLLKEVISEVIQMDLEHRDLPDLITITKVDTSKDLHYAKVFITIIENDLKKKQSGLNILQAAAGKIAVMASKKVSIRYFPSLTFQIDDSLDKYMEIDNLLKKIPPPASDPTTVDPTDA